MDLLTKIRIKLRVLLSRPKLWKAAKKEGARLKIAASGFVYQNESMKAKFYLPNYDNEFIQAKIIVTGKYYENDELRFIFFEYEDGLIGKAVYNHCILDVGTNIGNHTLFFLLECEASKVHCFEPMNVVFDILKRNIEINSLQDRVELHHVAVGAKSSRAKLAHFNRENMGATEMKYNETGDFPVVAIDDLQIEDQISFVKIDIEGFEYEALKGMESIIRRNRPYMMVEIREDNYKSVMMFMSGLGYKNYKTGRGINYLFIPSV